MAIPLQPTLPATARLYHHKQQQQQQQQPQYYHAKAHDGRPAAQLPESSLAGSRGASPPRAGAPLEQLPRWQLRHGSCSSPAAAGLPSRATSARAYVPRGVPGLEISCTEAAQGRAGAQERERGQGPSGEGAATAAAGVSQEEVFRLVRLYKSG